MSKLLGNAREAYLPDVRPPRHNGSPAGSHCPGKLGKHVMVKTTGGQEYHGNIQVIHQGYFTVLPDFQSAPVQIAYSEVLAAAQNLSRAAKIAIGILAALAMYAIIYLVAD